MSLKANPVPPEGTATDTGAKLVSFAAYGEPAAVDSPQYFAPSAQFVCIR